MPTAEKKKVLVGMSGGVDSTVSARLLMDKGYTVIGAALVFSDNTDISPAYRAAEELGIELVSEDCREDFKKYVISDFASEYLSGRTPNPCVVCNRYVKMKRLNELSERLGCDFFATGHYALPKKLSNGRYAIAIGSDIKKDQSYMLWGLGQSEISRFIAPLALFEKSKTLEMARSESFSSALSKESQDICFIPDGDYVSYIKENFSIPEGGEFVLPDGKAVGKHEGILGYTVGQRKGLGIALGYPAFVTDIDPVSRKITLSKSEEAYKSEILVSDIVFQGFEEGTEGEFYLDVKIRYAAKPVPARVRLEKERAWVCFDEPVRTPAPGQSCVFYRDGAIMLGGTIKRI